MAIGLITRLDATAAKLIPVALRQMAWSVALAELARLPIMILSSPAPDRAADAPMTTAPSSTGRAVANDYRFSSKSSI